jgi:integrase
MLRGKGERVNGPYKHRNKWRVITTWADGSQDVDAYASKAEATRAADEARAIVAGRTVMHAVDAFEVSQRERGLAPASVDRTRRHLNVLLGTQSDGHRPLGWLTTKRAAQLYDDVQVGHSVDTHRNALTAGKAFGKWCVKQGWLTTSPFEDVEPTGRRKRGKPQLHVDESRKLIDACLAENSRESLAVALTLLLGLRASEVAHRQVRDLDDSGRLLWIDKTKTEAGKRCLEVPEVLREHLLALAKDRPSASYLFGKGDLDRPTRFWLNHHTKRLCGVAKVPKLPPQSMRGTHATIATDAGSTSHVVAGALGHASTGVTKRHYIQAQALEASTQRAAQRVLVGNFSSETHYPNAFPQASSEGDPRR